MTTREKAIQINLGIYLLCCYERCPEKVSIEGHIDDITSDNVPESLEDLILWSEALSNQALKKLNYPIFHAWIFDLLSSERTSVPQL